MTKSLKEIQREVFSPEFTKYCKKNIVKDLMPLEKKRINYILGSVLVWIVAIVATAVFSYYAYLNSKLMSETYLKTLLLITGVAHMFNYMIVKNYKDKAKKVVLPQLISYIGKFDIIENDDEKEKFKNYLHNLDLISSFNRYKSDDYLIGTYKNIKLEVIEVDLKRKSSSGKRSSCVTVFNGLFIKFKSFKKFEGSTVIKRDFIKFEQSNEQVILEDPIFEKYFDVTSNDQIEARYLITPAFMNRLLELNERQIGKSLVMSFEHGNVNIAVPSEKDWFEISLLKPVTEIANYREIVIDLLSILSIIDVLKLDGNIGM